MNSVLEKGQSKLSYKLSKAPDTSRFILRRQRLACVGEQDHAPILGFPDFYSGKPFIVTTDASFVGLAYIISQVQIGKERILGYGCRKLSEAESRYHINKLELLRVVTCLEKNKFLLYSKEFILRVDSKAYAI